MCAFDAPCYLLYPLPPQVYVSAGEYYSNSSSTYAIDTTVYQMDLSLTNNLVW